MSDPVTKKYQSPSKGLVASATMYKERSLIVILKANPEPSSHNISIHVLLGVQVLVA